MRKTQINSGNFSTNGNFSGYNSKGERIFIHKNQMAGLGFTKAEDLKFPLFAIIDTKSIMARDADGNPTIATDRLQALSVFTSMDSLISAANADTLMEIESSKQIAQAATAAGLTQDAVNQLLALA